MVCWRFQFLAKHIGIHAESKYVTNSFLRRPDWTELSAVEALDFTMLCYREEEPTKRIAVKKRRASRHSPWNANEISNVQ